jgi:hypothetical protein
MEFMLVTAVDNQVAVFVNGQIVDGNAEMLVYVYKIHGGPRASMFSFRGVDMCM